MNMKPILFNTEMVRGLLNGTKTVTRRVVKEPYYIGGGVLLPESGFCMHRGTRVTDGMPYPDSLYRPGSILYVRETWQYAYDLDGNEQPIEGTGRYLYAADRGPEPFGFWVNPDGTHRDRMPWRPSIHMPREAARIFLRVTDVRVERLQDMLPCDIQREGCPYIYSGFDEEHAPDWYGWMKNVWDTTIKPTDRALYGWEANPWVWVIEFEHIRKEKAYRDC